MANKDQYLENNYPSLIAIVPMNLLTRLETCLQILEGQSNVHTKLFLDSLEDDIAFMGGEVLKWAVKKQGVVQRECLRYFDRDLEVMCMVFINVSSYSWLNCF